MKCLILRGKIKSILFDLRMVLISQCVLLASRLMKTYTTFSFSDDMLHDTAASAIRDGDDARCHSHMGSEYLCDTWTAEARGPLRSQ